MCLLYHQHNLMRSTWWEQEAPTKCISTSHSIDILARIVYIDFEGRSDGDSIRNILAKIKPRHLILVHGSFDATASLAD